MFTVLGYAVCPTCCPCSPRDCAAEANSMRWSDAGSLLEHRLWPSIDTASDQCFVLAGCSRENDEAPLFIHFESTLRGIIKHLPSLHLSSLVSFMNRHSSRSSNQILRVAREVRSAINEMDPDPPDPTEPTPSTSSDIRTPQTLVHTTLLAFRRPIQRPRAVGNADEEHTGEG